MSGRRPSLGQALYWLGPALGALAVLLLAAAGPGTRFGVWHFRTGLLLLRWAVYFGVTGALTSLSIALLCRRLGPALLAGFVLGVGAASVPWYMLRRARSLPAIHDVTTDLAHPPEFSAVAPLRRDAPNPVDYGGPEVAAQQRAAYPDLAPRRLDEPPAAAFARAAAAARALGWEIVAEDAAAGRLEATDTTFWFGFRDDVVVRVTPEAGGSRVDARSVSRVGRGDLGANAARLRRFLARL